MKSIKEKEECFLDGFCGVTAAAAGILSIRRKHVRMSFAILVAVFYSGCLIYFNV